MDNSQYMSVIAFMDEDSGIAGDQYLLEFCKIALFQNGYEGMNVLGLRDAVQRIVPFDYTEEDIVRVIDELGKADIELCGEKYELKSNAEKEIQSREKGFALRKYIDDYCDKFIPKESKIDRGKLCDLVTRFLFEKFQESVEQIFSLLDEHSELSLNYSEEYSEEERHFINDFLFWDNDEKNKMIYKLIVKSYDFCMINCPKEISFDFSDFRFYLDANIVMRLLGINNVQRQDAVKRFIDKCNQVGIDLYVSCYTKIEIEKSIDSQLAAIEKEIQLMGRIQSPNTVQFGFSDSFSIDLYRKFYEYCNKKKTRSLNGFRTYIFKEVEECISKFHYDQALSYKTIDPKQFELLSQSLKTFKDEAVVKTDVNNILLLQARRKETKDLYMVSADAKLIRWCKETFVGCNSLVEFPSVWLSIITKYTGRANEDDYSAFCKFIRLPIVSRDKDIKRKVEIKIRVESFDISDQMKDRIIDELNHNYSQYAEFATPDEVAQKAYDKLISDRENTVRVEEQKKYEREMATLVAAHEKKLNQVSVDFSEIEVAYKNRIKNVEEELAQSQTEGKKNSVHYKVQQWIETRVEKSEKKADWLKKHKSRVWLLLTIIIVAVISIMLIQKGLQKDISFIDVVIAGVVFFIDSIIGKVIDALIERFENIDEVTRRYEKKAKKRFKDLLK